MNTATWVRILDDETVWISHSANTLGKDMNPISLPPAIGKGIYSMWYTLKLSPAFSYNALGYLNENLTQNILVRKNKVHLYKNDIYFIHISYTQLQNMTTVSNHKKAQKLFHRTRSAASQQLKTYILSGIGKRFT